MENIRTDELKNASSDVLAREITKILIEKKAIDIKEKDSINIVENTKRDKYLFIYGFLLALAVFVINILVTELGKNIDSSILFSVSYAISILMTMFVGRIYYKEKITLNNFIGIFLCIGALVAIIFF
jgi:drug/metabolite transporter (DMT)-like permease